MSHEWLVQGIPFAVGRSRGSAWKWAKKMLSAATGAD